ncbi:transporter substrate-binding domain-containing protein [Alsobacter sp. SYSU BS001988]|jgi:polar amino acid transport system substrate-binding protein
MTMNKCLGIIAAVALTCASAAPAIAQSSLDAIVKRGKILVAIDMGSSPYAMTNAQGQPEGSDVEAAQLLAKDLGVELEIVPTTGQGRIPVLLSGKADLTMATFSITPERAKTIAFSNPYGVIRSVVFGAKGAAIKDPKDLDGKKIGVTRGTTQEPQLVATAPKGAEIIRFDDDATSISALGSGQVDALGTADNRTLVLEKRFPGKFEVKYELGLFYYSVGMRRNEPDLMQWVNTWVFVNNHNGKLGQIFEKWIGQKLPTLPAF